MDKFFRNRSDPLGKHYQTKEAKQKNKCKNEKKWAIKDRKNDWFTDKTHLIKTSHEKQMN